jgi:hypothetical protein
VILAWHEAIRVEHLPRGTPARLAVIDEHLIRRNQRHHQR